MLPDPVGMEVREETHPDIPRDLRSKVSCRHHQGLPSLKIEQNPPSDPFFSTLENWM